MQPGVAIAVGLGTSIREERRRRRWSIQELADRCGLSTSRIGQVELGAPASIAAYDRIATALGLRAEFALADPRRRGRMLRAEDPVHAAMVETLAARLRGFGKPVAIDEPYQHFQFAGRADLVAWDQETRSLLHTEHRTRFPNVGEAAGAFNAKRAYLGRALAERLGIRGGWRSETHVMVCLFSGEMLRTLRLRASSFASLCPGGPESFAKWWAGEPVDRSSAELVIFDPLATGSRRAEWVGLQEVPHIRPRYRDYTDALFKLKSAGLA